MAKDRKKLQHIHSSIPDKQPTAASLEVAEIAVNNAADKEFLSIKNTNDKVVRFSSDGQIIEWIERKEVMPYVGYVRGAAGPSATSGDTPTADGYGSYGIENTDLLNNKSELVFKLNQVAADLTTKHDKVNGKKDMYNKDVNPTTDGGINDGAGFFIDMSRYAMQDANPQFSSTTNTCRTTLSGTTIIRGLDGDCGSLLDIKVNSATTEVKTATTKVTSAHTTVGTATTIVSGDTSLFVSGTTTEIKKGNVIENHSGTTTETKVGAVVENHSGTTTENFVGNFSGNTSGTTTEIKIGAVNEYHSGTTQETKKGDVIENNNANKTENTSGNTVMTSTGNTCITSLADASFYGSVNTKVGVACNGDITERAEMQGEDVIINATTNNVGITAKNEIDASAEGSINITANDSICETAGVNASFYAVEKTNIGLNCDDTISSTTTNIYGETINTDADTANTTVGTAITQVTSANTNISTATTVIGTASTKVNSAYTSANTATTIIKTANTSATTATLSGNTLTVNENQTTVNSCGKVEINTDNFSLSQCSSSGGSAEFEFCNGYTVKSNDVKIQHCDGATSSSISIKEKTIEISGGTITETSTGNTTINASGNTNINTKGDVALTTSGSTTINSTGSTTIQSTGNGSDVCITAADVAALKGTTKTNIGKDCSDGGQTTTLNLNGTTINETGTTVNVSGSTSTNISGGTVNVSGGTVNSSSANETCITAGTTAAFVGADKTNIGKNCADGGQTTTLNINGTTINETGNTVNVSATTNVNISADTICESAKTEADFYAPKTQIGVSCNGSTATTVNISGTTINEGGTNLNQNVTNYDLNGAVICISGSTNSNFYGKETNIGVDCGGTSATTVNVSGTTINEGGTTNNNTFTTYNINTTDYDLNGANICVSGSTKTDIYGKETNIGVDCGGTTATTVNVSGTTINEGGTTNNNTFTTVNNTATTINNSTTDYNINTTNYDLNGSVICVSGSTNTDIYGKETNIGVDCGGTTATTVNVSGTTINEGGTTNNNTFTTVNNTATTINNSTTTYNITGTSNVNVYGGDVCISGGTEASLGAKTVKIGTDCGTNTIASGITINATTSVTVNAPTTIITGDTYISGDTIIGGDTFISGDTTVDGDLIINIPCDSITSTTVNDALCEIMDRGAVTMTRESDPEDIRLAAVYKLFQNGEQIGYDINVPKDGFLKSVELVPVENVFYLRFTWYVYDADTKTYTTASTDVNVEDLVKDIEANNTKTTDRGATVDVWYNATTKKMNVSADTVINLVTAANAGSERKNGQHYLSASTLTFTGGTFSADTYNAFGNGKTIHIPTSTDEITNNLKYLKWSLGTPSADTTGYNGSEAKTITIPSTPADIGMKDLKFTTGTTDVSQSPYNGSTEKTITIPSKISHLTNDLGTLTINYASTCNSANTSYNGSGNVTIAIPKTLEHVSCGHVKDTQPTTTGGEIQIDRNVTVTGSVSATLGFFQTSDERRKDNIKNIEFNDYNKVKNVMPKSFTLKDDESQRKMYGVIAQEVENAGLNELVHTDEEGYKAVDYTSLFMLKIAYLESYCSMLNLRVAELENKLNNKD